MKSGADALKEIVVANDLAAAKQPEQVILAEIGHCGYCENSTFAVKLALEEAITNAFRHGNKADPRKTIRVRYDITPLKVEIEIEDEGEGFRPDTVPDPTLPENIDRPHGRGIMLMRAYLDVVEYCGHGNAVRLVMHRK
ncbi:MAG TPA: ATP-binding protein [Phycisphaerae bacterium]|nr:ATP-binding protein [Phycisphaerae bacterium]